MFGARYHVRCLQTRTSPYLHKVSPHGKLPIPNDKDYNFNSNTYDGEFYQEEGLQGRFDIGLTEEIGMEVDNERDDDEDAGDEV